IPLVIAGEGPERQRLESLVRELKLEKVLFAGMVKGPKLDQLIAGCSFSVFPSRAYETLGKSILESYAWGRPVVASDLGSRREMVQEGETGLLFRPGDVGQLASAIRFLADRPALAARMGLNGCELLRERHSPESHYIALSRLYEDLAGLSQKSVKPHPKEKPPVRVAFIGGRGVISKYSGIETYYEEVGRRLAANG